MDEHREAREELAALDRDDGRAELAAERAYWQDVGLEPAERVAAETARWSQYRAAVKYAVDATRKEKIAALRDGLQDIAVELLEEHGLPLADVEDALDSAYAAAEAALEWSRQT